eukprot:CAMPEP_0118655418 /NCGR_PEP_ID=MMETSP0785-20121206/12914_1 /TAXON_ID=91992 /ORGANISM="Bolidomonas pacifica, Strain CCMP 1866" /LENGTH=89 /DNA_ID=CAMNT_0006548147 /DNA_START=178 /DNA_END=444 /DNA_ORIENTATION=-
MIISDASSNLYPGGMHINWTSKLSRTLLERLGKGLVTTGNQGYVKGMWDRYCGFTTLNPNVFTLNVKDSYVRSNGGDIKDIEIFVEEVA